MKKFLPLLMAFMFAVSLCACNKETESSEIQKVESTDIGKEVVIVYCTETGTKYHKENCIHLKSKYELTIEEAEERGLTPCSVCQP